MVMTRTRPHSGLAAQVAEARDLHRTADVIRRTRTELLGIPFCRLCGGATGDLTGIEEPGEIACVCATRQAELHARIAQLRQRHGTGVEDNLGDRLAP